MSTVLDSLGWIQMVCRETGGKLPSSSGSESAVAVFRPSLSLHTHVSLAPRVLSVHSSPSVRHSSVASVAPSVRTVDTHVCSAPPAEPGVEAPLCFCFYLNCRRGCRQGVLTVCALHTLPHFSSRYLSDVAAFPLPTQGMV